MSEEKISEIVTSGLSTFSMDSRTHLQNEDQGRKWRNLVGYWLLGLCNNYGYVVMLSAAHDILSTQHNDVPETNGHNVSNSTRDCNPMSTGAILLADILPSLFIKIIAPFLPFYVHIRVLIVILLSCGGFLLVALSTYEWMAILGVISTSLASGLGELTFLAYTNGFDQDSISMWSSGTGGAGIFGAGSYAGLTGLGISPSKSLLIMLIVPAVMAVSFWIILQHPTHTLLCCESETVTETNEENDEQNQQDNINTEYATSIGLSGTLSTVWRKICDIPPLLKYMLPLGAVYLFEYFINQGLFELIFFRGIWIDHKEQYRWLQLDYQMGVFLSRSSASCITIHKIWLMAVLQFINVILLTFEVLYFYIPSIWLVFALVLWEGTLGGGAYVNTYYRISNEISPEKKQFSLSITTVADAIGIGLAGALAIPVHNVICDLPQPTR